AIGARRGAGATPARSVAAAGDRGAFGTSNQPAGSSAV
ncbi:MAG: hypothetical protein AVDCRST_MAG49-1737, partial [uncultured Thermomicrobiales bacterium]